MSKKRIVTLTLNPALDLTVRLTTLVLGQVNLAGKGSLHAAGKGINVARVLRDFGEQVTVTGILGGQNRQPFDTLFREKELQNEFLYEEGATRINVKVSEESERVTDINLPGLTVGKPTFSGLITVLEELCDQADLFVLSGSIPRGLCTDVYSRIIRLLREKGKQTILDTSGAALKQAIAAQPSLIKPNLEELEQLAGKRLETVEAQDSFVRELLQKGIQHAVVSDGSKGVRWYTKKHIYHTKPPKVSVISTVGAGDSLVAGIAFGLANNKEIPETLTLATAIAAMAVTQIAVGITSKQTFDELKQQVVVEALPFSS